MYAIFIVTPSMDKILLGPWDHPPTEREAWEVLHRDAPDDAEYMLECDYQLACCAFEIPKHPEAQYL